MGRISDLLNEISHSVQHFEDDLEMLMNDDKSLLGEKKKEEAPAVKTADPGQESSSPSVPPPANDQGTVPAGETAGSKEETPVRPEPAEADMKKTGEADPSPAAPGCETKEPETAVKPSPEEKPSAEAEPESVRPALETTPTSAPWNKSNSEIWPKSVILARAKQAEKNVREWISIYDRKFEQLEFAFNFIAGSNRVHVVNESREIPEELWFIGDLHGDILALDSALSYIDSHSISPTIVFLGDLFDRFEYGIEVIMRVISLIRERPGKILLIAGNHDDGLYFKEDRFFSKVKPAEFVDFLNTHNEYKEFGKWLIDFCEQLPRALFLPDGLFVAHGGCLSFSMDSFSHTIDSVKTLEELEKPEHLRTFIWNRIIPDQNDKSESEVGKNDLIHFMQAMSKLTGIPVKRMLRGHDHCRESRHQFFDYYYPEAPVLTLTTMSAWYLGTEDSAPELMRVMRKAPITTPAIARFRYDELPEVITLDIPRSVIEQFHRLEELSGK